MWFDTHVYATRCPQIGEGGKVSRMFPFGFKTGGGLSAFKYMNSVMQGILK